MSNIHELPDPLREKCKADVVDLLEQLLKAAKEGEIIACAVSTVHAGLWTQSSWSKSDHLTLMIGAVNVMGARLTRELINNDHA